MMTLLTRFKKLVEPMQLWLLSQGRCVGCGKELARGAVKKKSAGEELVTCECQRVYVRNAKTKAYRRALLNELK
jgi:hypothetical protein